MTKQPRLPIRIICKRLLILPAVIGIMLFFPSVTKAMAPVPSKATSPWKIGLGRKVITPETDVWLAGYGTRREPEGKLHDLWVKVMVLEDAAGRKRILATTDHQGMSKTISERLFRKVKSKFGVERADFMLTFSHTHTGPRLEDDLVDYYPVDSVQTERVLEYTHWMEDRILEAIDEAWHRRQPAYLSKGEGLCTFAVNRRENKEIEVPQMLAQGVPLKGPVDHSVPVLAVKNEHGELVAVLFGYACHPTTLSINYWSGDYPGFAQLNLEQRYPGIQAMFFNTCGGDQNPLPRRTIELCQKYGQMLSDAVVEALDKPLINLPPTLATAFEYVHLPYEEVVTREQLEPIARSERPIQARWASRMIRKLDKGEVFSAFYEYPVQVWKFGEGLQIIGLGGEAVVDYALRFKAAFPNTWVSGYTHEMAAYIPSRRVWEEGGYEGGPHLDEYGRPAWRWSGEVEDLIAGSVMKLRQSLQKNE